jgi:hypothetical protein
VIAGAARGGLEAAMLARQLRDLAGFVAAQTAAAIAGGDERPIDKIADEVLRLFGLNAISITTELGQMRRHMRRLGAPRGPVPARALLKDVT